MTKGEVKFTVIPAQAGIQANFSKWKLDWVPTFVGMTVFA